MNREFTSFYLGQRNGPSIGQDNGTDLLSDNGMGVEGALFIIERVDAQDVQALRGVFAPVADEKITRDLVRKRAALRVEAVAVGPRRRLVRERLNGCHQRGDLRVIERQERRGRVFLDRVAVAWHLRSAASFDPRTEFLLGHETLARKHPVQPSGHLGGARRVRCEFAGAEAARKHGALGIVQAVHFFKQIGEAHGAGLSGRAQAKSSSAPRSPRSQVSEPVPTWWGWVGNWSARMTGRRFRVMGSGARDSGGRFPGWDGGFPGLAGDFGNLGSR